MNRFIYIVVLCMFPSLCLAQEAISTKAFHVALFNPIQTSNEHDSIKGMRFNLIYGVNEHLEGFDLGGMNHLKGSSSGLQLGFFNKVEDNFNGWQVGYFNEVQGDFRGLQGSLFNVTRGDVQGVQVGLIFNYAGEHIKGLQFGLVNTTGSLEGVQIGLINFNEARKPLGTFPIINISF